MSFKDFKKAIHDFYAHELKAMNIKSVDELRLKVMKACNNVNTFHYYADDAPLPVPTLSETYMYIVERQFYEYSYISLSCGVAALAPSVVFSLEM